MKKSLSKEDNIKISAMLNKFQYFIERKNVHCNEFYKFNLEFIKGFCSLILIEDKTFIEILTTSNEYTMYSMWAYIKNLHKEHPIYKYLRRFISLPDFFQKDIIDVSFKIINAIYKIDLTF